jgi:2-dehydro-3-deoxyphosphogluconate aldolase/(4S)-4-hydroxy-2-oxoglutarate aldolase
MDLLKAWSGPFPTARFIPTGGVNETNASQYRALANVVAVGGSWMVPKAAIEDRDWAQIEALARASLQLTA